MSSLTKYFFIVLVLPKKYYFKIHDIFIVFFLIFTINYNSFNIIMKNKIEILIR